MNDVTEEEYQWVLMKRKSNKYAEYNREYGYRHYNDMDPSLPGYEALLKLKVKEVTDADEMVDAVKNNNIDLVKSIFERDNVEIPYKITHDSNSDTGFGYEMKYEYAAALAYKLGFDEIVRYLFDKNVCADTITKWYNLDYSSKELKAYILKNMEIPAMYREFHHMSVPKHDPRGLPRAEADDVYNMIEMHAAIVKNDIEKAKYVFRRSREYPRKIEGYNESYYHGLYSNSLLVAVRHNRYEIFVYLVEHKVGYERLLLLNYITPEYVKGRYDHDPKKDVSTNPRFTYSPIELYIINVMPDVLYDDYTAKNITYKDREKLENINTATRFLDNFLIEHDIQEFKNNMNAVMDAVNSNNLEEIERILSVEPKNYSYLINTAKIRGAWDCYLRMYIDACTKSVELGNKYINIFKCFVKHGIKDIGIALPKEFMDARDEVLRTGQI